MGHLQTIARARGDYAPGDMASWNVRWWADPRSALTVNNRGVIEAAVTREAVVLLQETRWDRATATAWGARFIPPRTIRLFVRPTRPAR
eukprot:7670555-Lingulodinium_polyedra.AAC.1